MNTNDKELAVAALKNGTVFDHIPSNSLFKAVSLLGIENIDKSVTIGNNLESKRYGKKGIIKVADTFFPQEVLNRIAIIAPSAVVNTIENYKVVKKEQVVLPPTIVGLVKCNNPKCITRNEPMKTRFDVVDKKNVVLRCHYCSHEVTGDSITLE